MRDPRVDELARILVQHSTAVKPGERVLITGGDLAKPLILSVYREAILAGSHPLVMVSFEETARLLLEHGSDAQLTDFPPILLYAAEHIDAYIQIEAPSNTRALSQTSPQRQAILGAARRPFLDRVLKKRWVLCQYPTDALAQEAQMSLAEYADFLFGATNIDWTATRERLLRLKEVLEAGKTLRIVASGTDLTLSTAGRLWIPCDGEHNMPDGEIFTGPIEDSANGYITFDYPVIHRGREVEGVRLEFKDGEVVAATATRGEEYLRAMLDTDAGARRLGEIGIGTNYGITRFTKSILFDEKIGGTVHLAVGRSYEETGGVNQSAVHWDMIKDLRQGGVLYLDGQIIQENGEFRV